MTRQYRPSSSYRSRSTSNDDYILWDILNEDPADFPILDMSEIEFEHWLQDEMQRREAFELQKARRYQSTHPHTSRSYPADIREYPSNTYTSSSYPSSGDYSSRESEGPTDFPYYSDQVTDSGSNHPTSIYQHPAFTSSQERRTTEPRPSERRDTERRRHTEGSYRSQSYRPQYMEESQGHQARRSDHPQERRYEETRSEPRRSSTASYYEELDDQQHSNPPINPSTSTREGRTAYPSHPPRAEDRYSDRRSPGESDYYSRSQSHYYPGYDDYSYADYGKRPKYPLISIQSPGPFPFSPHAFQVILGKPCRHELLLSKEASLVYLEETATEDSSRVLPIPARTTSRERSTTSTRYQPTTTYQATPYYETTRKGSTSPVPPVVTTYSDEISRYTDRDRTTIAPGRYPDYPDREEVSNGAWALTTLTGSVGLILAIVLLFQNFASAVNQPELLGKKHTSGETALPSDWDNSTTFSGPFRTFDQPEIQPIEPHYELALQNDPFPVTNVQPLPKTQPEPPQQEFEPFDQFPVSNSQPKVEEKPYDPFELIPHQPLPKEQPRAPIPQAEPFFIEEQTQPPVPVQPASPPEKSLELPKLEAYLSTPLYPNGFTSPIFELDRFLLYHVGPSRIFYGPDGSEAYLLATNNQTYNRLEKDDWIESDPRRLFRPARSQERFQRNRVEGYAKVDFETLIQAPSFEFQVDVPQKTLVGSITKIRLTVKNVGTVPSANTLFRADLPRELSHPAGRELDYMIGALEPGEKHEAILLVKAESVGEAANRLQIVSANGIQKEVSRTIQIAPPAPKEDASRVPYEPSPHEPSPPLASAPRQETSIQDFPLEREIERDSVPLQIYPRPYIVRPQSDCLPCPPCRCW